MDSNSIWRRLRGMVGIAVLWGAAWCLAVFAVSGVMALAGESVSWTETWQMAARLTVIGGFAGVAFSTFIGLAYRGRRLVDLSWVRFGFGGGVVAGLFVPALMLVGRMVSGDGPLPLENFVASGLLAAAFGSVSAAASLKLAQRVSLPPGREQDQLEP